MKKLKKLKDGLISRQIATAKLSYRTAKDLYRNRDMSSLKETLHGAFKGNLDQIVDELDLMKGSLMKAGQMLSLFGGSFLPDELKAVLKKLENKSSYLEWDEIKKQLPPEWTEALSIEEEPLASASLGQVHMVEIEGAKYCMKIQYRGVRKAINNDIRALKMLLKLFKFVPKEVDLQSAFSEIKSMLILETDYLKEAENTKDFKKLLEGEELYRVPSVCDRYSNEVVLTTEFLDGHSLHDLDSLDLSQAEKNGLGRSFMRLFFLELFIFEKIQTDAHFGNYLILKEESPRWGLLDFGATKEPSPNFIKNYQRLILALRKLDRVEFLDTVFEMGYLSEKKESDLDLFWEYANIVGAPFQEKEFEWGRNNISDQIFEYVPKLIRSISVGNPPSDTIFLDRKLGGVYFVLQKLDAKFDLNEVLDEVLELRS